MEFIAYFVALIYLEKCFYTSAFRDRERQRVRAFSWQVAWGWHYCWLP